MSDVRTRFVAPLARSMSAKALIAPTIRTKEATSTSMSVKPDWARRREASVGTLIMRFGRSGPGLERRWTRSRSRTLNDEAGPGGPASRSVASVDAAYHLPVLGQPLSPVAVQVRVTLPFDAFVMVKALPVLACVTTIV